MGAYNLLVYLNNPVATIEIKAAKWDSFMVMADKSLVVKLGSEEVAVFSANRYSGLARKDLVVTPP